MTVNPPSLQAAWWQPDAEPPEGWAGDWPAPSSSGWCIGLDYCDLEPCELLVVLGNGLTAHIPASQWPPDGWQEVLPCP